MKITKFILTVSLALSALSAAAQYPILIHSHNDYQRTVPLFQAYAQKVRTVECDMHYMGGSTFLVGHDSDELSKDVTFDIPDSSGGSFSNPLLNEGEINNEQE